MSSGLGSLLAQSVSTRSSGSTGGGSATSNSSNNTVAVVLALSKKTRLSCSRCLGNLLLELVLEFSLLNDGLRVCRSLGLDVCLLLALLNDVGNSSGLNGKTSCVSVGRGGGAANNRFGQDVLDSLGQSGNGVLSNGLSRLLAQSICASSGCGTGSECAASNGTGDAALALAEKTGFGGSRLFGDLGLELVLEASLVVHGFLVGRGLGVGVRLLLALLDDCRNLVRFCGGGLLGDCLLQLVLHLSLVLDGLGVGGGLGLDVRLLLALLNNLRDDVRFGGCGLLGDSLLQLVLHLSLVLDGLGVGRGFGLDVCLLLALLNNLGNNVRLSGCGLLGDSLLELVLKLRLVLNGLGVSSSFRADVGLLLALADDLGDTAGQNGLLAGKLGGGALRCDRRDLRGNVRDCTLAHREGGLGDERRAKNGTQSAEDRLLTVGLQFAAGCQSRRQLRRSRVALLI